VFLSAPFLRLSVCYDGVFVNFAGPDEYLELGTLICALVVISSFPFLLDVVYYDSQIPIRLPMKKDDFIFGGL
jgi:hypothetical protein